MARNYPVLITEHLQITVNVNAESAEEAVEKVRKSWTNAEYILDADHFTGVEISALEDGYQMTMLHRDKNGNEYLERRKLK